MTTVPVIANGNTTVERNTSSYRIPAFDFTKGTLVLFMVLYHWLNYFYEPEGDIYKYLRFLTPSFIFITGFLISHVHFAKYGVGSARLSKRLFLRGLKLLGVFIGLNLLVSLLAPESIVRNVLSERPELANLDAIFFTARISGNGAGKAAAFFILVPISYLLMLAALLSLTSRRFRYTFHVACAMSLLWMVLLDLRGVQSGNLELVTIGLFGVALGHASGDEIQKVMDHTSLVVFFYCVYLIAITIWDVSLYVQMVGACLTTALIYIVGSQTGWPGRLRGQILLLGRYSLFGYISQIAILQLLRLSVSHVVIGPMVLAASFIAGFGLTLVSVQLVVLARVRSKAVDGLYRAVFT